MMQTTSWKMASTVFLFSSLLFSACSQEQKQEQKREIPPLNVQTVTVQKQNIPIWIEYTGTTKSSSKQEVKARVNGILEKVYFKDGAHVRKGQKLFKIEQDEYIANLNEAKAKKAVDEASLRLAIADVNRYQPLVDEGLAPRATLEQYESKKAALKAQIMGDKAKIKKAQIKLDYTIIKAPISGNISARRVDVGNLVGPTEATTLTTIVQDNPLYAYFSTSTKDFYLINKYKEKEKLYAFIEVRNLEHSLRLNGYIDFSNNVVDNLTSTVTMRATIANKDYQVMPGTFVYVNIFLSDKYKFIMISPEVIFNDQLGKYVYTLTKDNKLKRSYIKTDYSNRYYVSVSEGLKDGDRVVVSSLIKLKEKMSVNPTDVTQEQGIQAILKTNNLLPKKI
ncbi:efflux RND transporter periplasmic adaptor subunit [Sulfurimonas sp.]|uniref:efflux RND transporter periplasmic adaptor subunit n=1 Tax=Sulfurimonas sp. TaxID=2022749 RepID=UPI00261FC075|nr:efflux RND transporter periplasmic adaptor subunit [Sulfurimonas sp.]